MTYDELVVVLRAAGCVFAEDEAELLLDAVSEDARSYPGGDRGELDELVARRVAGEPLEYILGWVDFCGLQLAIEAGVFVPRQRTEFLVEHALTLTPLSAVVVDLCCGCGALGIAVGSSLADVELHSVDIEPAAVDCAIENVGVAGQVYLGDLYAPLPPDLRGRVDTLLANVPYVPTAAIALMPPEAREHEPLITLDGGPDGQDVMRRVIAEAPQWLAPGGHLLIETSVGQVESSLALLRAAGLTASVAEDDERGATVIVGRQPPAGL